MCTRWRRAAEDVPRRGEAAGDGLDDHLAGIQEGHDGVVPFGPTGLVTKDGRTRRKRRMAMRVRNGLRWREGWGDNSVM